MFEGITGFDDKEMVITIQLLEEDYGELFKELLKILGDGGEYIIDLSYGGFTHADVCSHKSPRLFFKKLEVEINKDFKGVFNSEKIDEVIYNLIEKYGWHDCQIITKNLTIEQNHDEYFIIRPKIKNKENWKKLLKTIEKLVLARHK